MKASTFLAAHPNLTPAALEQLVLADPSLVVVWGMTEVTVTGNGHTVSFFASDDYFAIGEPDDCLRIPLSGHGAQALADSLGCCLPTQKMVDATYRAATRKLAPVTGGEIGIVIGGQDQMSVRAATVHSHKIDQQLLAIAEKSGLVAGHKKDVVVSNRLLDSDPHGVGGSVAIYGWHRLSGVPIQPLSLFHEDAYSDYSHGIRLVGLECILDGQRVPIAQVLSDPKLAPLLNYDGVLRALRYPPRPTKPAAPAPAKPAAPTVLPTLRLGSSGAAVERWQRILLAWHASPLAVNGEYDADTRAETIAFQLFHKIGADGVVGTGQTWPAGLKYEGTPAHPPVPVTPKPPPPMAAGDLPGVPFKQARNYQRAQNRTINQLVLHDMEMLERADTAEACANMFATTERPASAHLCVDSDSEVQCVRLDDVAYAAPGTNLNGIHFEHAGFARQNAGEWDDDYSRAMLQRSAKLAATICEKYGLPIEFVDAEGLLDGERGITTHAQVSKACLLANQRKLTSSPFYNTKNPKLPRTDHSDPGVGFPLEHYLQLVMQARP